MKRRRLTTRTFARRAHIDCIEKKPKIVEYVRDQDGAFFCKKGIELGRFIPLLADFATSIENGNGPPEQYYRSSRGYDYLLDERNWIHVHVGKDLGDDDTLLLLEQTATHVIFIMLTDHSIFKEVPRGKSAPTRKLAAVKQKIDNADEPKPK